MHRLSVVALVGLLTGCSVLNTGPRVAEQTIAIAAGAAESLLQSYQPENMSTDIHGDVNDPRYRCKMFAGTGVLVDVVLSLEGVDLGFGIDSEGGGIEVDAQLRQESLTIISNKALTEEQRKTALMEAVLGWLGRMNTEGP